LTLIHLKGIVAPAGAPGASSRGGRKPPAEKSEHEGQEFRAEKTGPEVEKRKCTVNGSLIYLKRGDKYSKCRQGGKQKTNQTSRGVDPRRDQGGGGGKERGHHLVGGMNTNWKMHKILQCPMKPRYKPNSASEAYERGGRTNMKVRKKRDGPFRQVGEIVEQAIEIKTTTG